LLPRSQSREVQISCRHHEWCEGTVDAFKTQNKIAREKSLLFLMKKIRCPCGSCQKFPDKEIGLLIQMEFFLTNGSSMENKITPSQETDNKHGFLYTD